jgi:hypothetical protein
VQLVASVEDHVRLELAPEAMLLGAALNVTVGADAPTDTVVDCAALPPRPLHVSV